MCQKIIFVIADIYYYTCFLQQQAMSYVIQFLLFFYLSSYLLLLFCLLCIHVQFIDKNTNKCM